MCKRNNEITTITITLLKSETIHDDINNTNLSVTIQLHAQKQINETKLLTIHRKTQEGIC